MNLKHLLYLSGCALVGAAAYASVPAGHARYSEPSGRTIQAAQTDAPAFPTQRIPGQTKSLQRLSLSDAPSPFRLSSQAFAPSNDAFLNAVMVYNESWTQGNAPMGVYSLSESGQLNLLYENQDFSTTACYGEGMIYSFFQPTYGGSFLASSFIVMDAATGATLYEKDFEAKYQAFTCTWHQGKILLHCGNLETKAYTLAVVEPQSGAVISSVDTGGTDFIGGLCSDQAGHIYGLDRNGALYSIDGNTLAATPIAQTGITNDYCSAMAWVPSENKIYCTTSPNSGPSSFYSITAQGVATLETTFANCLEFGLLYVPEAPADPETPGAATALAMTFPEDNAASLTGTFSFLPPTTLRNGSTATGALTAKIYVDGTLATTVDTQFGASAQSVNLTMPSNGVHTIMLQCENEKGAGIPASITFSCGVGIPALPEYLNAANGDAWGKVDFEWSPVTQDVDGKTLPEVHYSLWSRSNEGLSPLADALTDTQASVQVVPDEDAQQFLRFAVFAENEVGVSEGRLSQSLCIGKPFSMPWREGFANAPLLAIQNLEGTMDWSMATDEYYDDIKSFEGDNAFLVGIASAIGDKSRVYTGRVLVDADAVNPVFSFYYYGIFEPGADHNTYQAYVNDGSGWTPLGDPILPIEGDYLAWNYVGRSLEAYKGKAVQVAVEFDPVDCAAIALDAFAVTDRKGTEMAVSLVSASEPTVGESMKVTARVENNGDTPTPGRLSLLIDHRMVAAVDVPAMQSGAYFTHVFDYNVPASAPESIDVKLALVVEGDENSANNDAEATFPVLRPDYPMPGEISSTLQGDEVTLSWAAADGSAYAPYITDDFESYDSFATFQTGNHGDWIFLDLDGNPVGGFKDVEIPNVPVKGMGSFFITDNSNSDILNSSYVARSGFKQLGVLFNLGAKKVDDWAISPELSGKAQTISFWARGYSSEYNEGIEVLYSSTGTDPNDFTSLKKFEQITRAPFSYAFNEYTVDLPAGAKYFALRYYVPDKFMALIDDVRFQPATAPLNLLGYNVYRNGEKLNAQPLAEPSFTVSHAPGNGYSVTALYDRGESAATALHFPTPSSISGVQAGLKVIAGKGELTISGTDGTVEISDMNGRNVYSGASGKISLPAGLYIVCVEGRSLKAWVK